MFYNELKNSVRDVFDSEKPFLGVNEEGDKVEGDYPITVTHDDGDKTLVVTAGCHGKYVGVLNLTFDFNGKLAEWSGNPVVMDEKVPEGE